MIEGQQRVVTILWVEDVPASIKANVWKLGRQGFKVKTILSLNSAKEALRTQSYDLIFIDYSLPMDDGGVVNTSDAFGLRLIEEIRSSKSFATNPDVKIVLCTAQRESIGNNREKLIDLKVEVLPKSNSYFEVMDLACNIKEVLNA